MSVKINYLIKKNLKSSNNLIFFTDEKYKITNLKKFLSNFEFNYISDLLKTSDQKKKILIFEINSKKRIILVSVKSNYEMANIESLGAELYTSINVGKSKEYFIDTKSLNEHQNNLIDHFAHGPQAQIL